MTSLLLHSYTFGTQRSSRPLSINLAEKNWPRRAPYNLCRASLAIPRRRPAPSQNGAGGGRLSSFERIDILRELLQTRRKRGADVQHFFDRQWARKQKS